MLDQALVDPAQRKEKIAAREMAARLNIEPAAAFRQCLRRDDIVERRRQLVEDPTGRSAAQQRKASASPIAAGLQRFLIRGQRLARPAGVEQRVRL